MDLKESMDNISEYKGVKKVYTGKFPELGEDYHQPTVFVIMRDRSLIYIVENDAFSHKGYNGDCRRYGMSIATPFHRHVFDAFKDSYRDTQYYKEY